MNIELISYAEVVGVSGSVGNFKVKVRKKARSVKPELCTSCGTCIEHCPVRNQPYPVKGLQERLQDATSGKQQEG
jgi:heterodisulfide reductase subunit A2